MNSPDIELQYQAQYRQEQLRRMATPAEIRSLRSATTERPRHRWRRLGPARRWLQAPLFRRAPTPH